MRLFWLFAIVPVIVFSLMFNYVLPSINTLDSDSFKSLPDTTCYGKYGKHTCKDISGDTLSLFDKISVRNYENFKKWSGIFVMFGIIVFFGKLSDMNRAGGSEEKEIKKHNTWTLRSEFGISDNKNDALDSKKKDNEENEDISLREFTSGNML